MAIKSIIASLEDAPENVRSLYREGTADEGAEGKFILDVEPADGFSLENVDGLKSALSSERTEHGKNHQRLQAHKLQRRRAGGIAPGLGDGAGLR